ncbi:hypothetical protein DD922_15100, partial [Staphylococcus pseudintermedius]
PKHRSEKLESLTSMLWLPNTDRFFLFQVSQTFYYIRHLIQCVQKKPSISFHTASKYRATMA